MLLLHPRGEQDHVQKYVQSGLTGFAAAQLDAKYKERRISRTRNVARLLGAPVGDTSPGSCQRLNQAKINVPKPSTTAVLAAVSCDCVC
jgi:hypothetical protein